MKKIISIMLTLALCLGLATAFAVNEDVSGNLMIYTSMYPMVVDAMTAALKEEFPNAQIEFFYAGTGKIQDKVVGEMETGTLGCDMMLVADPSYAIELQEGGWLHSFDFEGKENLAFEYDKEGYWYPVRGSNMILAYNPEMKNPEELPKTFKEFAENEALKGKISMSNPLTSGTALVAVSALKDKYGYEYYDALGKNAVYIESGSTAISKLESGECDVIMILEESILQKRKDEGSKIAVIYPEDGNIVAPSPVIIIDESKSANVNTELAEAVANWLLAEEGQKVIVNGFMHSVLKGFPEKPFDSIESSEVINNAMPVDWVSTYKNREELRNEFQQRVTQK